MKTLFSSSVFLTVFSAGFSLFAGDWDASKLDASKLPAASSKQGVTYAADIRPLFEASCFRCHGGEKHKGGLRLDNLGAVLKGGEDGKILVPKDSAKSVLVFAIAQVNNDIAMPPKRGGHDHGPGGQHRPEGAEHKPAGGGNGKPGGPPAKPLTAEQVGLVRAWIDQGAK